MFAFGVERPVQREQGTVLRTRAPHECFEEGLGVVIAALRTN